MKINNDMYSRPDYSWWGEENTNTLLKCFINPLRFQYFRRVIESLPQAGPPARILDVGCGGGLLSEQFAGLGFQVTGVDPSQSSLRQAAEHAAGSHLHIEYLQACGESLPFEDETFDCAACCDVLEHVHDVNAVVREISRVLKPGGLFFYDTINRTVWSLITVIFLMQECRLTAFEEPGTHVWRMFVKPSELNAKMMRHGLMPQEIRGMASASGPVASLGNLRERARNRITRYELGERLKIRECNDTSTSYMGYAIKKK